MDKCKVGRKGRHQLAAIIPGDDDHDITLYCEGMWRAPQSPGQRAGPAVSSR